MALGCLAFVLVSLITLVGMLMFFVLYGFWLLGSMVLEWAYTSLYGLWDYWGTVTTIDNRLVKGVNITYRIESRAADSDRARNLYQQGFEEEREWRYVMKSSQNLFDLLETYKSNELREYRIIRIKMSAIL
jgi:hypothetical protein